MATTVIFVLSTLFVCQAFGNFSGLSHEIQTSVDCTNATLKPHPDVCKDDFYVLCYEGKPHSVLRCTPPLVYVESTTHCDYKPANYAKPAQCTVPTTCDDLEWNGYLPVKDNCRTYQWCYPLRQSAIMNCPVGAYFIQEFHECRFPSMYNFDPAFLDHCHELDEARTTPPPTENEDN